MLLLTRLSGPRCVIAVLLLLFTNITAQAQVPDWQMAMTIGRAPSNQPDVVYLSASAMATDSDGNIYITGSFSGRATFGTTTLVNSGDQDVFVAKWNPTTKNYIWAVQAGGSTTNNTSDIFKGAQGRALAVSGSNVYVSGIFSGAATFGTTSLSSVGASNMFVAKISATGNDPRFGWVQHVVGGTTNMYATNQPNTMVAVGANVYLSGSFWNTVDFGSKSVTSAGETDIFLTKLTDAGSTSQFVWAERIGGTTHDNIGTNALVASGSNIYVTATTSPVVSIGTTTLPTPRKGVVAKFTDAGLGATLAWAYSIAPASVLAVSGNSLYMGGTFSGSSSFGTTMLTSAAYYEMYVGKLTDTGSSATFDWALQSRGTNKEAGVSITALEVKGSDLYLSGSLKGLANFGNTQLDNYGNLDFLVAKITDTGTVQNFAWAKADGGGRDDRTSDALLIGSTLYVVGEVIGGASFGSHVASGGGWFYDEVAVLIAITDNATVTTTNSPVPIAGLSLYPNPAHHHATVLLPAASGATLATLTLIDALGRVAHTQRVTLSATPVVLPLTGLTPGLYTVRVQAGAQVTSRLLAVE